MLAIVFTFALTLGACGGANAPATDAGGETPSSGDSGGSGSSGGPGGDTIKIGYVNPISGPLASLSIGGKSAAFIFDEAYKVINDERGGIDIGGKKMKVEIIWGDSESDPTKAQEVATKLVTQDNVDMLLGCWTPATTGPVSAVGERYNVPTVAAVGPDISWLPGGPYEWVFGIAFDYDKFNDEYFNGWDKMDTNKKIGLALDSSIDSVGMADIVKQKAAERGYTIVDPGRYPEGTMDYMQILTQIQNEGCDIFVASTVTPEIVTIWNQCNQLGYIPKTAVLSKGMHAAVDVLSLGEDMGVGVCIETMWSPQFPWANSINGKSARELSDDFESALDISADFGLGLEWALAEVSYDALTRAGSLDPEAIRQALKDTNLVTSDGRVVFDDDHVGCVPIVFGQWVRDDKWGYKKVIVSADHTPEVTQLTPPVYIPGYTSGN